MNPIRNSAKAIIIRDGCILLIRMRDQDSCWHILPGGGQNHGETLHEALQRECQEEIGVRVTIGELRLIREYIGSNHEFAKHDGEAHQVEFMFECQIDASYIPASGTTPDTNQTGVVWVPLSDLPNCNLYPKVLVAILANGVSGRTCGYLGDLN